MKRAFVFKLVLYNLYSLYAGINNLSLHILGNASIEEINIQVKIKHINLLIYCVFKSRKLVDLIYHGMGSISIL